MNEPGVAPAAERARRPRSASGDRRQLLPDLARGLRAARPGRVAQGVRLGAALLVPLLAPGLVDTVWAAVGYAGLLGAVALTTPLERSPALDALDVGLAAGIVVASGGLVLPFLPLLLALVTTVSLTPSVWRGLATGTMVTAALAIQLEVGTGLGAMDLSLVVPALALPPLTGVAAALGARTAERGERGRRALQEANRLLEDLDRVASELPGSLDVRAVCRATLEEIRTISSPTFVGIYLNYDGVLVPAASAGIEDVILPPFPLEDLPAALRENPTRLVPARELPPNLAEPAEEAPHWVLAPLRRRGDLLGIVLAGYRDPDRLGRLRARLGTLAGEAALALDSAKLLDRVRDRALQTAQRQMANDLHDGVAQSLTHLRMELELLARGIHDPDSRDQAERLSRVAHRSLTDVRTMIAGLRRDLPAVPFTTLLRDQLRDLNGLGVMEVRVTCEGEPLLTPIQRADLAHLVQEAVSNALRHSNGTRVDVLLVDDENGVHVSVTDDGAWADPSHGNGSGSGVGRSAMRERADRLGGRLSMHRRRAGGTVVSVTIPSIELLATGW